MPATPVVFSSGIQDVPCKSQTPPKPPPNTWCLLCGSTQHSFVHCVMYHNDVVCLRCDHNGRYYGMSHEDWKEAPMGDLFRFLEAHVGLEQTEVFLYLHGQPIDPHVHPSTPCANVGIAPGCLVMVMLSVEARVRMLMSAGGGEGKSEGDISDVPALADISVEQVSEEAGRVAEVRTTSVIPDAVTRAIQAALRNDDESARVKRTVAFNFLPLSASVRQFRCLFDLAGTVLRVRMVKGLSSTDPSPRITRRFQMAFVEYTTKEEAARAVATLHGMPLCSGLILRVSTVKSPIRKGHTTDAVVCEPLGHSTVVSRCQFGLGHTDEAADPEVERSLHDLVSQISKQCTPTMEPQRRRVESVVGEYLEEPISARYFRAVDFCCRRLREASGGALVEHAHVAMWTMALHAHHGDVEEALAVVRELIHHVNDWSAPILGKQDLSHRTVPMLLTSALLMETLLPTQHSLQLAGASLEMLARYSTEPLSAEGRRLRGVVAERRFLIPAVLPDMCDPHHHLPLAIASNTLTLPKLTE